MTLPHGDRQPPRVHIVGAFDRFNYGDILFAHLSERAVRGMLPDAEIRFVGTRAADLRLEGGVQTLSQREMFARPARAHDVIWVAGGEVLGSRWHLMFEHNMTQGMATWMRRLKKRLGSEWTDSLLRRLAQVPNRLPWVFDPVSFPGVPPRVVYYNVGGLGVSRLPPEIAAWERTALNRATWLSLRDSGSVASVAGLTGRPVRLAPDSAVLMDALRPAATRTEALARVLARIREGWHPGTRYICVQCGINYVTGQEDVLAAQIKAIHEQTGLPVVSFAIGRAAGHEDHVSGERLHARLGAHDWFLRAPNNLDVWEIMALIAGSAAYVGTSLHGFITAFVFRVPRVGLLPRVRKLQAFQRDWDLPGMPSGVEMADLSNAVGQALGQSPVEMTAQTARVQAQSRAVLADLHKIMVSDPSMARKV